MKLKRSSENIQELPVAGDGVAAEPSESAIRKVVLAILLIVTPLVVLGLYYRAVFHGLISAESMDFAQLGRNLSEGRGFVTYVLRPLALTHGDDAFGQRELVQAPLFPFLLALAFGALGAKDTSVLAVTGASFVCSVWMTYLLGARVFSRPVGIIAAVAVLFSSLMLEYAVSGLHITLILFLGTCWFYSLYRVAEFGRDAEYGYPFPRLHLVLVGVLTAALYLTDYVFLILIPLAYVLVPLVVRERRLQAVAWFSLPLAVIVLPWMARNAAVGGNPLLSLRGYEVWMNTGVYPAYTAYQGLSSEMTARPELLKGIVKKVLMGLAQTITGLPGMSGNWLLAFFLPSLLFPFADAAANSVRRVAVTSFAAVMLATILLGLRAPLLVWAVPVMLVFGAAFLAHLAQQANLSRSSVALVGSLLVTAVLLPILYDTALWPRREGLSEEGAARVIADKAGRHDVVLSDSPQAVAWYADRPAIWLPLSDETTRMVKDRFQPRWLLATQSVRQLSPPWQVLYDRLVSWNVVDQQARRTNEALQAKGRPAMEKTPPDLTITGRQAPLFEILQGFTTVSIGTSAPPTTIVARLSGGAGSDARAR